MEDYWGILKYIITSALYLAHYYAQFHKTDDAKKCRYLNITNNFIFSYNSFKLLSHEVLEEECFAMDPLIKIISFSNKCNFSAVKPAVYC